MIATELAVDAALGAIFLLLVAAIIVFLVGVAAREHRHAKGEGQRFDLLMAEMSDAVVVRDAGGTIKWGSPSVQRVFGYDADAMVGTSLLDLIHPDDLGRAMARIAEDDQVGGPKQAMHLRARHAHGHWIEVEAVATNLLDDPRIEGVVINLRDVSEQLRGEKALSREHDLNQAVLDTAACIIVIVTPDGRLVGMNRAAESMSGYTSAEMAGRAASALVAPEDRRDIGAVAAELAGDGPHTHENRWLTKAGELRLVQWTNTAIMGPDGRAELLVGTGIDITEQRRSEETQRLLERRFRVAFDHSPGGMALLDSDGRLVEANAPMALLLGGDARADLDVLGVLDAPEWTDDDAISWDQQRTGRRAGDERTLRHRLTRIGVDGEAVRYLLESEDVTDQVRDQGLLAWQATHDLLTGLANRAGLTDHLARALADASSHHGVAVLLIDLDGFKAINDRHGHQAGDEVLVAAGHRLLHAARDDDMVVRLGGDEFVVVAHDITHDQALGLLDRIVAEVEEPVESSVGLLGIGASVGLAMGRPHEHPDELLARADQAMYSAKAARRLRLALGAVHEGAPLPPNEPRRLATLRSLHQLDTDADPVVDRIARIAAEICGTPISAVSLVDESRQWFKSIVGLQATETSREEAFCAHTILGDQVFTVPDAALDSRFRANPLVVGDPLIRFYAGAPLVVEPGLSVGALCVIDREPRHLTPGQTAALADLARLVTDHMLAVAGRGLATPPLSP